MSIIYENDNNKVCVQLSDNDYVLVMGKNIKSILKIINKEKKLVVETIKRYEK